MRQVRLGVDAPREDPDDAKPREPASGRPRIQTRGLLRCRRWLRTRLFTTESTEVTETRNFPKGFASRRRRSRVRRRGFASRPGRAKLGHGVFAVLCERDERGNESGART